MTKREPASTLGARRVCFVMSAFLRTFGGLRLEPMGLSRPKPLLLLAYLALEGPRDRRFVAELFWPKASHHMNNLRVELARFRREAPGVIEADSKRAWISPDLDCDAKSLLALLDLGRAKDAVARYEGSFCDAFYMRGIGTELEEWLYATREFIASQVRGALIELAEAERAVGRFHEAETLAARAYGMREAPIPEHGQLVRIHTLLAATGSPRANQVAREAREFGLSVRSSVSDARAQLTGDTGWDARGPFRRLPAQTTPFVGRDLESMDIASLIRDPHCRLLTLLGPAGAGKTSLALQVARDQQRMGAFANGVAVVGLEALGSSEQLSHAIANAIGLHPAGSLDLLDQVARALADQRVLLVLDNFEEMMAEVGKISSLLRACPGTSILITSRQRLNLDAEHVYTLRGLAYPDPGATPETALRYEATTLFIHRAKRLQPHFQITDSNASDVLEICALVDGLPLGIELATTWLRVLTCAEIARELRQSLDLLTSRDHHAPARHKSIRGAFETSWNRLDSVRRQTLRKLAVFRDGFSREAASEVAGATIPTLTSLLDSSLLRIGPNGRFDRHPLLYQYIREKLEEAPDTLSVARRDHAAYYARMLERHAGVLHKGGTREILGELAVEFENVRTAWLWAVEHVHIDMIRGMAGVLERCFVLQGRHREGLRYFERAILVLKEGPPSRRSALGRLLGAQARLHQELGDYADGERLAHRALALLRAHGGDEAGDVGVLDTLGRIARHTGHPQAAKRYWEEALAVARLRSDRATVANQLGNIALLEVELGEDRRAEGSYRQAIELSRTERSHVHVVRNLNNLAHLLTISGRLAEAEAACGDALELAAEIGFEEIVPHVFGTQSMIAFDLGDHDRARAVSGDVIRIARERGSKSLLSQGLTMLGVAATHLDDHVLAWRSLREALEVASAIGYPPATLTALSGVAELWMVRGRVDAAARLTAVILYHGAVDRHTLRRVRSQAARLRERMPPDSWSAATEAGAHDHLGEATASALRWELAAA